MPEGIMAMITGEGWCGPGPEVAAERKRLRTTGFAMNCTWGVTERCQGCHGGLGQSKGRLRYGDLREEQVWVGAG